MLGALKAAGAAGLVDAVLGVAPHGAAAALGLVAFSSALIVQVWHTSRPA
jgi:hypothetical protein